MNFDFTKPLPAPTSIDGLIAEYANYEPRYVEESGSRWHVFFANLFPEVAACEDNATVPIKGLAN